MAEPGRNIPVSINRQALLAILPLLEGIPHCVFFGTLLGLVREGDLIAGDDDVDILVDQRYHKRLVRRLLASPLPLEIRRPDGEGASCLLHVRYPLEQWITLTDFYLFTDNPADPHVVERWNFFGAPHDPRAAMHIPKDILYPFSPREFFGVPVSLPANPEACCAFLYGEDWHSPLQKGNDYTIAMVHNRPVLQKNAP